MAAELHQIEVAVVAQETNESRGFANLRRPAHFRHREELLAVRAQIAKVFAVGRLKVGVGTVGGELPPVHGGA